MPNWCNFTMYVKGSEQNVRQLEKYWDYDNLPEGHESFARTFEVFELPSSGKIYSDAEETIPIYIYAGQVAWSVFVCWFDSPASYPYENKNCVTIVELAKRYDLEIEIMSDETGMAFMEHFYITPDGVQVHDRLEIEYPELSDDEDMFSDEVQERINDIISEHHEALMYLQKKA